MRRTRIIALVAVPVLLLGAGCRGGAGARGGDPDPAEDSATVTGSATGGAPEDSSSEGGAAQGGSPESGSPDGGVEGQFDDVESTLNSIESEMADDGR
jgi:hypothetical protein